MHKHRTVKLDNLTDVDLNLMRKALKRDAETGREIFIPTLTLYKNCIRYPWMDSEGNTEIIFVELIPEVIDAVRQIINKRIKIKKKQIKRHLQDIAELIQEDR